MNDTPSTDTLVPRNELASLLGVSLSTLKDYYRLGMPGAIAKNKYPVRASIDWLINHQLQQALKSSKPQLMTEQDAKARKLSAEAQLAELELAAARGEVVNVSDATKELERYLSVVRASLLSFPARFAPYAVMIPDEKAARLLLDEHIAAMMTDIVTQTDAPPEEITVEDDSEEEDDL